MPKTDGRELLIDLNERFCRSVWTDEQETPPIELYSSLATGLGLVCLEEEAYRLEREHKGRLVSLVEPGLILFDQADEPLAAVEITTQNPDRARFQAAWQRLIAAGLPGCLVHVFKVGFRNRLPVTSAKVEQGLIAAVKEAEAKPPVPVLVAYLARDKGWAYWRELTVKPGSKADLTGELELKFSLAGNLTDLADPQATFDRGWRRLERD